MRLNINLQKALRADNQQTTDRAISKNTSFVFHNLSF